MDTNGFKDTASLDFHFRKAAASWPDKTPSAASASTSYQSDSIHTRAQPSAPQLESPVEGPRGSPPPYSKYDHNLLEENTNSILAECNVSKRDAIEIVEKYKTKVKQGKQISSCATANHEEINVSTMGYAYIALSNADPNFTHCRKIIEELEKHFFDGMTFGEREKEIRQEMAFLNQYLLQETKETRKNYLKERLKDARKRLNELCKTMEPFWTIRENMQKTLNSDFQTTKDRAKQIEKRKQEEQRSLEGACLNIHTERSYQVN